MRGTLETSNPCGSKISPEWLNVWTSTNSAKNYFESRAKQSTNLASISATNIREFPVLLPSEADQRAIVADIEKETTKLDALREATERTITLLKERRAALIAAAVTGKLGVSQTCRLR
jgi:restriction endonuclease S subunit